jgi:hypothetical protein
VIDPFAMAIATNVATKITDALTTQAQQATTQIVRRISQKVRSKPDDSRDAATLNAAIATGDAPAAEALARLLEQLFAADPRFREEVQELWDSADVDGAVTNLFYGKADKVIMMRDVKGDLTINLAAFS